MSAIEQYKSLLSTIGISADIAQANGFRLRPDHVYIPHIGTTGHNQGYRRLPVGSRLLLDGQFSQHAKTKVYFARHATRPKTIIEYIKDYDEPLILCDSILDTIYLQSQLAQSAIQAQCIYIALKHYPKPTDLPLSTITQQKRVWITPHTSTALLDHLRAGGAICHKLRYSSKYTSHVDCVRNGGSLADMMHLSIKSASQTNAQRSLIKTQDKAQDVIQWLTMLPRQVYSLADLHKQLNADTGLQIGKTQLSHILTKHLPQTARRSISVYVPAVSYRAKPTMKAHTLISIRQHDYWQTSSNAQWIAEYEQRFNTKHRIGDR
jgi:hypothetical protein